MTTDLLTPEEFERIKALNWGPDTWMPTLIATLEAAWAENEKLRTLARNAEKATYGYSLRIMCDNSCGCPLCLLRDEVNP